MPLDLAPPSLVLSVTITEQEKEAIGLLLQRSCHCLFVAPLETEQEPHRHCILRSFCPSYSSAINDNPLALLHCYREEGGRGSGDVDLLLPQANHETGKGGDGMTQMWCKG